METYIDIWIVAHDCTHMLRDTTNFKYPIKNIVFTRVSIILKTTRCKLDVNMKKFPQTFELNCKTDKLEDIYL